MARRQTAYSTLLDVVLNLPWPVDAGLAAFFYLLFHWMSGAAVAPLLIDQMIQLSASILQFVMPAAFMLSAWASLRRSARRKL